MKFGLAPGEFLSSFGKLDDRGRGDDYDWMHSLCHGRGLETKEDKDAYVVFAKVMKAETPEQLDGISVEQLLSCWERRDDFESAFTEGNVARVFFQLEDKFQKIRTRRKRRVL